MGAALASWRALRLVELLVVGALICCHIDLATRLGRRPVWVRRVTRWWFRRLCRGLGLRVECRGKLAPGSLVVANHVSWLDIALLGAQGEITFLSKADVRRWPVVGWMCAVVGTEFIERGGNQVAHVTQRIIDVAAAGGTVAIFPEGTTTEGDRVGRFHPRLFAAARQGALTIQPVALSYHRGSSLQPDTGVAYVGEQTLVANLWVLIRHPGLVGRVRLLAPFRPVSGEDRRALCVRSRGAIVSALGLEAEPQTPSVANGARPVIDTSATDQPLACGSES